MDLHTIQAAVVIDPERTSKSPRCLRTVHMANFWKKVQAPSRLSVTSVNGNFVVMYHQAKGGDDFVRQVNVGTPFQLVEAEDIGVDGRFLKDLS